MTVPSIASTEHHPDSKNQSPLVLRPSRWALSVPFAMFPHLSQLRMLRENYGAGDVLPMPQCFIAGQRLRSVSLGTVGDGAGEIQEGFLEEVILELSLRKKFRANETQNVAVGGGGKSF